ncbi:MAG: thiamine pyrophosphate-dependent enzyme [bacterium]
MQKSYEIPRELLAAPELLQPGILSCQGCGASLAMKLALKGLGRNTVAVIPACCWSIIIGTYPYCALQIPVVHAPFASAAAVASGVRAGLDARQEKDVVVMAWAGDGGTFDIGIQSLSGAAERNEDILFVCYDNEAYMNTGIQRSSATPAGAWTTTTPAGALKAEAKKDIVRILLAHQIPWLATASVAYPDDLIRKFRKARRIRGTRFIHLLSPCPPGWRIDSAKAIEIARMATLCRMFPIFEADRGRLSVDVLPEKPVSVRDYMRSQGRFRQTADETIAELQRRADERWQELLARAGLTL